MNTSESCTPIRLRPRTVGIETDRQTDRSSIIAVPATTKAKTKAQEELSRLFSFTLKEKWVIPDSMRDMINDLVTLKNLQNKVDFVVPGKLPSQAVGLGVQRGVFESTEENFEFG
ncbi:hypothetical protein B0H13DRAFT_1857143 [Mycena leptocephala]|nr:hypothetical protein B0H13DRAFT_1857143 [Mycena leptocephala]